MRKIKVAPHQAQVTDSILVIRLHCDFIDFSGINLIFYCTKESRLWKNRKRRRFRPLM